MKKLLDFVFCESIARRAVWQFSIGVTVTVKKYVLRHFYYVLIGAFWP